MHFTPWNWDSLICPEQQHPPVIVGPTRYSAKGISAAANWGTKSGPIFVDSLPLPRRHAVRRCPLRRPHYHLRLEIQRTGIDRIADAILREGERDVGRVRDPPARGRRFCSGRGESRLGPHSSLPLSPYCPCTRIAGDPRPNSTFCFFLGPNSTL